MSENPDSKNPSRGILRDVQNVKTNGAASLAELREFIGALKGRKPQEIMGEVASNGLVQGIAMSSIGFLIILLVFTVIPYLMAGEEPDAQNDSPPAVTTPNPTIRGPQKNKPQSKANPKTPSAQGQTGDALLENLGIGETKKADPNENPLGEKFNDLLKEVK
ncbi:MAG: hypothetical protein VX438_13045 [Planctomycetota bacterium]|nr:hypothetical protein [Planctomycetota bacterium]